MAFSRQLVSIPSVYRLCGRRFAANRKAKRRNLLVERLERREVFSTTPIISEFLASNSDGLRDSDGESSDWIEIYNPTDSTFQLNDWALTDDSTDLNGWKFPDVPLAPGEFLTVFASGKNRRVVGQELHTNFRLSSAGDFLALVQPNGTIVSQFAPTYPVQATNVSYGVGFATQVLSNATANARVLVPTNGSLGTTWTGTTFSDTSWTSGQVGVGYGIREPGFSVSYVLANSGEYLGDINTALAVLNTPSRQANRVEAKSGLINYLGTGAPGNYLNDGAYPTQNVGDDINNFLIEAKTRITIPTAGAWTFGVNSDDGFRLTLTDGTQTFTSEFFGGRGASDTIQTFTIPAAGDYDLTLVQFEGFGGASVELFAAQGAFSSFNAAAFDLVGDRANGGLAAFVDYSAGPNSLIKTDIAGVMQNQGTSAYIRIPFNVSDPTQFDSLRLRMRYDDGFVAYLNGVEVARRNAPTTAIFNSVATLARDPLAAITAEDVVFSQAAVSALQTGNNVLAIHGLNSALGDSSFLVLPELIGSKVFVDQPSYFGVVTPGAPNQSPALGVIGRVVSSADGGFYDAALLVSLTTPSAGATIRYTLDGSEPTETNGIVYSTPISISQTSNLRALAYRTDYVSLPSITRSFIYLNDVLQQADPNQPGNPAAPPAGWPVTWRNNVVDYGIDPDIITLEGAETVKAALKSIQTWSITTDLPNLFDPATGIYSNPYQDGRDWERESSVEIINPDGTPGVQANAGLRIRGGYSRSEDNPKHSFRLFFRGSYGDSTLDYPLFGTEGVSSFKKIDLRTAQNYSWSFGGDPSNNFVADYVNRLTQRDMGQPYTRSNWIHLYLNGQYWGLYQTQERAEAEFAQSYFGGVVNNYDVIKAEAGPYANYATDGNMDAYTRLWEEARAKLPTAPTVPAFGDNANYFRVQGKNPDGSDNPNYEVLLDVDNVIVYMINILYGGNLDAPISAFIGNNRVNNYYAIRDRTSRNGFKFFLHDSEHTLRNVNENRNGPWTAADFENSAAYFNPQWLHQQLMANADYRLRFADTVQKEFFDDGALSLPRAIARVQGEANKIDQAIIAESARWGDAKVSTPLTRQDWLNAIIQIIGNYLPNRDDIVLNQFQNTVLGNGTPAPLFPTLQAPRFIVNGAANSGGVVPPDSQLRFSTDGGLVYYTQDGTDPRLPDGSILPSAQSFDPTSSTSNLFSSQTSWKYRDNGADLGSAWRANTYDDSTWAAGNAELGFGDNDEATRINTANAQIITAYFRKEFTVASTNGITALTLRLKRDDGAIVYINGVEAVRSNMPTGVVTASTLAASNVVGAEESQFYDFVIDPGLLRSGSNVIAVEVHQIAPTSSDISFDAELVMTRQSSSSIVIPTPVQYAARARDSSGNWSPIETGTFTNALVPASAANLRVTEVHYNPRNPEPGLASPLDVDTNYEFIELRNTSTDIISLAGVRFTQGIDFDFTNGSVPWLRSGEVVVVAKNLQAFQARYGTGINVAGIYPTKRLSNGGDRVALVDAADVVIQDFTYDDTGPGWHPTTDGGGPSLTILRTSGDYNLGSNWRPSYVLDGTPGVEENDGPFNVLLSSNSVLERTPGAKVGDLSTVDIDDLDTATYSILPGLDGSQFTILGTELRVGTVGVDFNDGPTRSVNIRVTDGGGATLDRQFTINVTTNPRVISRNIYYRGSAFDTTANSQGAIDTSKQALVSGRGTDRNVSGAAKGINGVIIDVNGVNAASLTAADFQFRTGSTNTPASWTILGATPTIQVLLGQGLFGSTRIKIELADNSIRDTWLQVTVLANARTNLSTPDVSYFGHAAGNVKNRSGVFRLDASDLQAIRYASSGRDVPVDRAEDLNKDRKINSDDLRLAQQYVRTSKRLSMISI